MSKTYVGPLRADKEICPQRNHSGTAPVAEKRFYRQMGMRGDGARGASRVPHLARADGGFE